MSGTFSSFNTALSALRYNRVAMDTASQNIANVGVDGYTRRRVDAVTAGTPTKPAMWSRDQGTGGGVRITGVTRMADYLLDLRRRTEHGKQSYLDTRQAVLDRQSFLNDVSADSKAGKVGVFVHGYNSNYQESLYRLAQITADGNIKATPVAFSWPSRR